MNGDKEQQVPHAQLYLDDFQTILSVLEGYVLYLKRSENDSEPFQTLYTKIELLIFQAQSQTLYLKHEEVLMVLRAIFAVEDALHNGYLHELAPYRETMKEKVGGVRARLLAAFPFANRSKRACLN